MSSPNALLLALNRPATVSVEKLLRAAHIVALTYDDQAMADWCSAELQGYSTPPFPEYRLLPSKLMGTDAMGSSFPLTFEDAETTAMVSKWPATLPISLIEQHLATGQGRALRSSVPPSIGSRVADMFELRQPPHVLIQVSSLAIITAAVRHKVFLWAVDASGRDPVKTDRTASVEAMLGVPASSTPTHPAASGPLGINGLYAASGSQVVILANSPGATVARDTTNTNEVEVLQTLLSALEKVRGHSIGAGASGEDVEPVEALIDEVKSLVAMPKRRPDFVRSTLSAIQELTKATSTAVAAEIAKPYVISALGAAQALFSSAS